MVSRTDSGYPAQTSKSIRASDYPTRSHASDHTWPIYAKRRSGIDRLPKIDVRAVPKAPVLVRLCDWKRFRPKVMRQGAVFGKARVSDGSRANWTGLGAVPSRSGLRLRSFDHVTQLFTVAQVP